MDPNLFCKDNGIKLPKNKAAEIGQNDRAKIMPNPNEPMAPELARYSNFSLDRLKDEIFIFIISNKNRPTINNIGPRALFKYVCNIWATVGMLSNEWIRNIPKIV